MFESIVFTVAVICGISAVKRIAKNMMKKNRGE